MSSNYRLTAVIGDTEVIVLPVMKSGAAWTVTDAEAWFYGKRKLTDSDADAVLSASTDASTIAVSGSTVTVSVPASQTDDLTRDTVLFWACRIKETGGQVTTIDRGELKMELGAVTVNS